MVINFVFIVTYKPCIHKHKPIFDPNYALTVRPKLIREIASGGPRPDLPDRGPPHGDELEDRADRKLGQMVRRLFDKAIRKIQPGLFSIFT
jgi:hypothetical protein